jgi:hypothetical protein
MRCPYYLQSLVQHRGVIQEIGSWIWRVLTRRRCSSELRSHQSDRCRLLVEFCPGERLGEFPIVSCCCCFDFWLVLEPCSFVWWIWDFLAGTGLAGDVTTRVPVRKTRLSVPL